MVKTKGWLTLIKALIIFLTIGILGQEQGFIGWISFVGGSCLLGYEMGKLARYRDDETKK